MLQHISPGQLTAWPEGNSLWPNQLSGLVCDPRVQGSNPSQDSATLRCFHMLMNLLGAIGTLMEGTSLSNILETVYGGNAVGHMMTGKAVQRALRGHMLVDKCLHSQLITEVAKDNPEIPTLLDQAEELYSSFLSGEMMLPTLLL